LCDFVGVHCSGFLRNFVPQTAAGAAAHRGKVHEPAQILASLDLSSDSVENLIAELGVYRICRFRVDSLGGGIGGDEIELIVVVTIVECQFVELSLVEVDEEGAALEASAFLLEKGQVASGLL